MAGTAAFIRSGDIIAVRVEGLSTTGPDALDHYRVCEVHEWASSPATRPEYLRGDTCPQCAAARDRAAGTKRYYDLHMRIARLQADDTLKESNR